MSLRKRGNTWWIDITTPSGQRIRESAETPSRKAAQEYHDRVRAEAWRRFKLGDRPRRTWDEAALRFLKEAEGKAEQCRGQEREREVQPESLRSAIGQHAGQSPAEPRPVLDHDRNHGASLDHNLEDLGALAVKTKKIGGENQVPRARNRQELGEPFHDAEDERMQQRGVVHESVALLRARRRGGARALHFLSLPQSWSRRA